MSLWKANSIKLNFQGLLTLGWFWVCKGSLLRMPGKKQKSHSVDSALTTPKKNEASCDSQKEGSKEQTESTPVQPLLMETFYGKFK